MTFLTNTQCHILAWPWNNLDQGLFKVIDNATVRKLGYGFLFVFYSNYGRIFSRFDTHNTGTWQPAMQPLHYSIGRTYRSSKTIEKSLKKVKFPPPLSVEGPWPLCSTSGFHWGCPRQGLNVSNVNFTHREGRWRSRRPRARHGGAKRRSAEEVGSGERCCSPSPVWGSGGIASRKFWNLTVQICSFFPRFQDRDSSSIRCF